MIMPSNTKIHVSTRSALAAEINTRWPLFANFGDQTAESERRKLSSTPYALVNPYRRTWLPSTSKRQVTVIVTAFSGPVALPEMVRKKKKESNRRWYGKDSGQIDERYTGTEKLCLETSAAWLADLDKPVHQQPELLEDA